MSTTTQTAAERWTLDPNDDPGHELVHIVNADDLSDDVCELSGKPADNARRAALILAAPDLLKACKVVKRFLDSLEDPMDPMDPMVRAIRVRIHAPLHQALDAAIAKADGPAGECEESITRSPLITRSLGRA